MRAPHARCGVSSSALLARLSAMPFACVLRTQVIAGVASDLSGNDSLAVDGSAINSPTKIAEAQDVPSEPPSQAQPSELASPEPRSADDVRKAE